VTFPHVAILGRIPGTKRFSDRERHPDNELVPGVLLIRVEASLLYFNVDHVRHAILGYVDAAPAPPRHVVVDLSASPHVDLAGARMLAKLAGDLEQRSIALRLAEARATVRDLLREEGLETSVGSISRYTSVADVVDACGHPDVEHP
jgi:MFS superfamily sulfate permease-like transporter